MATPQKIIFLDIDGPVIPWRTRIAFEGTEINPPCDAAAVHFISKIAERADAKIVLSSQLRLLGRDYSFEQLVEYGFDPALFHDDWATPGKGDRLMEIHDWLARHPDVKHWIAIDDEALDTDHLVMACSANGFLLSNYDEALNKFGIKAPKLSDLFYWKARIGFEGPIEIRATDETQNTIARLHIPGREP